MWTSPALIVEVLVVAGLRSTSARRERSCGGSGGRAQWREAGAQAGAEFRGSSRDLDVPTYTCVSGSCSETRGEGRRQRWLRRPCPLRL